MGCELTLEHDCEGRAMADLTGTTENAKNLFEMVYRQYLIDAQGVNCTMDKR